MNEISLTIRPTPELVFWGDTLCRVWVGEAPAGPCKVLVAAVGVTDDRDKAAFDAALVAIPEPACRRAE